jgi:hypothetical protein
MYPMGEYNFTWKAYALFASCLHYCLKYSSMSTPAGAVRACDRSSITNSEDNLAAGLSDAWMRYWREPAVKKARSRWIENRADRAYKVVIRYLDRTINTGASNGLNGKKRMPKQSEFRVAGITASVPISRGTMISD